MINQWNSEHCRSGIATVSTWDVLYNPTLYCPPDMII
jgi:hypothetical protein